MGHSYTHSVFHVVFGTKNRRKLIDPALEARLWPYLGGIARENGMKALAIGGVADHVHILLSLPATSSVSKAVQLIKGGSSLWVHESFPEHREFQWQEGYGAFSIGVSGINKTIDYIHHQPEHHRSTTFEEEFVAFLQRHDIPYDERFVCG